MMKADPSIQLSSLPLRELRKVRDLEWFEGPLLSEFRTASEEPYLYSWCDVDRDANRWILFRTTELDLIRYEHRRATLRDIMLGCPDGFVFLVDIGKDQEIFRAYLSASQDLPLVYVPGAKSYFDPDMLPGDHVADSRYDILINKSLDEDELGLVPRRFRQVYSFLHLFSSDGAPPKPEVVNYKWRGGFVVNTFFLELHRMLEPGYKPVLDAVQYASPGFIRWRLHKPTAAMVRESVERYQKCALELESLYKFIQQWSSGETEGDEEIGSDEMRQSIHDLAEMLGFVNGSLLLSLASGAVQAGRIMASYYRRVKELAYYQQDGKVTLL